MTLRPPREKVPCLASRLLAGVVMIVLFWVAAQCASVPEISESQTTFEDEILFIK